MCFFRKKQSKILAEDRERLNKIEVYLEAIITAFGDNEVKEQAEKLKKTIHFLVPSDNKRVLDADKDVCEALSDISSNLIKKKNNDKEKVLNDLKDIEINVALRNTKG